MTASVVGDPMMTTAWMLLVVAAVGAGTFGWLGHVKVRAAARSARRVPIEVARPACLRRDDPTTTPG
jgi:hypothetical protein